jgi:hypothetical protein
VCLQLAKKRILEDTATPRDRLFSGVTLDRWQLCLLHYRRPPPPVAAELEAMFAVEAKKRMLKKVRDPRVNSPQGDHGKARDLAADVVSVSPRMVEYAKTIKRDTPLSFQCSPRASCIFPNWEFCISRLTTLCTTPNRSPISSCVQPS